MSYRDEITALEARRDALRAEIADKQRALASSESLLAEARSRASLPVLDNLRIATPCPADWSQMTGDDRVRFCGQCEKHVYDLSGLTRSEAEELIHQHAGKLCARFYQRPDGTILLADCEVGQKRVRKRRRIAAAAALLLGTSAGLAGLVQRLGYDEEDDEQLKVDPDYEVPLTAAERAELAELAERAERASSRRELMGDVAYDDGAALDKDATTALERARATLQGELERAQRELSELSEL